MWSGLLTCLVLFGFWLGQDLGLILDRISLRGLSHAGGVLGFLSVLAADSLTIPVIQPTIIFIL